MDHWIRLVGESRAVAPHRDSLADLARGQRPFATILGCSDSRVPPEWIFDAGLGELFVIRVAGNVLSPEVAGSLQYANQHLQTPLFLVLGAPVTLALQAAHPSTKLVLRRALDSPAAAVITHPLMAAALFAFTLPDGTWVRNVAAQGLRRRAAYRCPLEFDRIEDVLSTARQSLAEAYELCGRAADAAHLFAELLKAKDTLPSRRGEPSWPRKYFGATTLVASCDQAFGTSTSSCSNTCWPLSPWIPAARRSQATSS